MSPAKRIGARKRASLPATQSARPPASVWDLASEPEHGQWPPAYENARQYAPLGPWSEEANDTNRRSAA